MVQAPEEGAPEIMAPSLTEAKGGEVAAITSQDEWKQALKSPVVSRWCHMPDVMLNTTRLQASGTDTRGYGGSGIMWTPVRGYRWWSHKQ